MELLQCVNTNGPYKRAYHSEDREMSLNSSAKSTPRQVRSATLSGGERRVSLPNGHYSASTMGRASSDAPRFRHYGSSLSLAEGHGTHELTSRTLRPPSPTTLRKSSTILPPSAALNKAERSPRPSLPNMRVELESPKLADYLEKPRLVNAIKLKTPTAEAAKGHHAKRYENGGVPEYRNLRLGNFMEEDEATNEEVIPDLLRQYYLDTFLNSKYDMYQITHSM